ncbi:MAG: hypothetical protein VYA84_21475 [Planctomycetota bacterium]|nr:hypothetical protein [Planctomycetota bacterium]
MSKLSIAFTIVMVWLAMNHGVGAVEHTVRSDEQVAANKQHDPWSAERVKMRDNHLPALAVIAKLPANIVEHEAVLVEHEGEIRAHEGRVIHHGEEIRSCEDRCEDAACKKLEKEHVSFNASHPAMAEQREKVRANHEQLHTLLSKVVKLVKG